MATFHFVLCSLVISTLLLEPTSCEEAPESTNPSQTTSSAGNFTQDVQEALDYAVGELHKLGMQVNENSTDVSVSARMKMSDFINPYMLVPQLIMWGFAPILLANLKMFVMQALMLNKMALNAAIFMTLRNIVFGPRPGPVVKYANHGYKHEPGHSSPHYLRRRS